ncbi:MAG: immunoglobulin domain-containing protein [Verrucomicrobia bacterium]|nr:immunoglobulin domain-containing protein [Verrucomicrobiota bacterium]
MAAPARAQSGHFRTQPQSQFVQIGQTVTLSATLGGGQPTFQWQKNGAPLPGATTGSLTVTVASAADAGSYTLVVSDRAGSETSAPALLYLSRLANFSVRATLSPAAPSVTLGHGIVGRGSVVLLRAIGPGLGQFGVRDGLADPRLTVLRTLPASSNSGWSAAPDAARVADEARRLGAFALAAGSADAALYSAVEGTVFSAEAVSASNATGAVLLELYHADPAPTNRLVNVSARARLGARDDRIAAGFVLAGQARTTLLIRAVGPSLAAFGLSGALAAPRLELIRAGSGEVLVRNDQWAGGAELRAAFAAAGAFPLAAADSKDAALLVTLEPGAYSAQLTGVDGALGDALVELYVLP